MLSSPMLTHTLDPGDTKPTRDSPVLKTLSRIKTVLINCKTWPTALSDISFGPYALCSQNAIKDRCCLGLR
jgi:hypothetical protein